MTTMQQLDAARGDLVHVSGRRVGSGTRHGEILEVLGEEGRRHYLVRWEDGHESVFYPGEATSIEHRSAASESQLDLAAATRELVALLREETAEFELLPHRRTMTAASEARVLGVLPQAVAKTVIACEDEGGCIRAVVPASTRVDLGKLAAAASTPPLRLLSESELVSAYPQFELGAVPPFGGPAGDRVVFDRSLGESEHVVFDGGVHDTSLRMRTEDLIAIADGEVADIAAG